MKHRKPKPPDKLTIPPSVPFAGNLTRKPMQKKGK